MVGGDSTCSDQRAAAIVIRAGDFGPKVVPPYLRTRALTECFLAGMSVEAIAAEYDTPEARYPRRVRTEDVENAIRFEFQRLR